MANKLVLKRSSVAAKVPLATDLVAGELAVNLADAKLYTKDGSGNVILVGSGAAGAVSSVAGKTGAVTLVKADVGLGNVDNTSDASKPVSTAQQTALDLKSNLASPTFTGTPAAPTAAVGTNTTQLATTAYVNAEIANDATPIAHVGSGGTAHAAASTSVAGFMSAADKTKLDGVAAGATNVTNTNQLTNGAGFITSAGNAATASTATNQSGGTVNATTGAFSGLITANATITAIGEAKFYNTTFSDPDPGVQRAVKISNSGLAVGGGTKTDSLNVTGTATAASFSGAGTGLTGTAASLSIGGNAATASAVPWSGVSSKPTTLSGFGITDATPSSHVGSGGTQHAAASTSVAGFMSAADKTKLDGVASGATANTGTVTGVTATAPVVSSGGTAPVISMAAATAAVHGYMTSTYAAKLDGIAAGAQVNTVTSVAGRTGAVTLAVADVSGAAPLATPTFTGTPAAPTAAVGTNTTQLATTAYVNAEIANDAPTKTGGGASGTWGISISGNAATASNGGVTSVNGLTGAVTVTGAVAGGAIYENSQAITANYTITSGKNALSAGPITINSGITVTVPSGSTWVVV